MADHSGARLQIRAIASGDKVNKLQLKQEDSALGAFLARSCIKYESAHIARTYVLYDAAEATPCRIRGYISILLSEVRNDLARVDEFGEEYKFAFPAIKIARLAVDRRHQGQDYGTDLIAYCLALIVKEILPRAGCRFVVVDANRPAIDFYKKMGFEMVETEENKARETPVMFLDLKRLVTPPNQPASEGAQAAAVA